jgi:mono/diheme cytochrome c family protein
MAGLTEFKAEPYATPLPHIASLNSDMKPNLPIVAGAACSALCLTLVAAAAQQTPFPPERIAAGAALFSRNCSPCHGTRMKDPESAFDLRKFPHEQHERFVSSVTNGKNQMPPWGDILKPQDIEALWAYVVAGER